MEAEVPFTAFSPLPQGCQSSQPGLPAADLPARRVLAGAALGVLIAAAFLALATALGLLLASALYGYGGLG